MSDYMEEYRAMPAILGTIEPDAEGPGGVQFVEEAEVVGEWIPSGRGHAARAIEAVPFETDEIRVVDPSGGMKGSKLAKFSMIPPDVLNELAEHYGKGEAKYPSDPETGEPNWQKGYNWRLSVDALERHLNAWKRGEDFDPETGSSHLIAVMWHAAALRWFQNHGRGRDYRDMANGRAA